MFNVTVLKMKDIRKYLVGIILTIIIVMCTTRYFSDLNKENKDNTKVNSINIKKSIQEKKEIITKISVTKMLNTTIPLISDINTEYNQMEQENQEEVKQTNYLEQILKAEITTMGNIEEKVENDTVVELAENNENEASNSETTTDSYEITSIQNEKTEIVTQNPISENYNTQYEKVKIKNQTEYQLTQEMLTPDIKIENKNILLFHTHTCESYTSSDKYSYESNGNYRTTDLNFTVAKVGTELTNWLKSYNYNVIHDTTYHDYPSYTGSYTRSLATVEGILQTTPSDIIMDIHRDAVGSRSDYAPTVKIGDEYAAQIMFVIGTNGGGLWHPNWNQNLKFAIKVQEKAEEKYPGLFKPIMLTNSRYNQHSGKYASIIEVGATGNTLDQCLVSMKYLASVINEVVE